MKIIIDNGTYELKNLGDVAMLKIAVMRLRKIFPNSSIKVITRIEDRLDFFCPEASPLNLKGRGLYIQPWNILGGARRLLPNQLHESCLDAEDWIRLNFPKMITPWIKYRLKKYEPDISKLDEYQKEMVTADMVVASGGGYINDSFPKHAEIVLRTLQFAQKLGKPTALLGQGIGPLNNQRLRRIASQVLKNTDLIGLREGLLGPDILNDIGVPEYRVTITGDDALELGYRNRTENMGSNIGINLRISSYSPISQEMVNKTRKVLHEFVDRVGSYLQPIPISFYSKESDIESIKVLLNDPVNDPAKEFKFKEQNDWVTPEAVMALAGSCRIVVTGSYHAAVFALSQGIPAVGLSKSQYYVGKFTGLKKQFGEEGVEHVMMNSFTFEDDLKKAMEKLWNSADIVRTRLLEAAARDIKKGLDFYDKLQQLC